MKYSRQLRTDDRAGFPRPGAVLAICVLVALLAPAGANAQEGGDDWAALKYRYVGPIGNRVSAVVGVPGDRNVYFAGAASGGVFKSTDGGVSWRPVFDDQPVQAIGSLAVAPSDANVVWAGTGETFIRSNVVVGNGVYKSVDGGESWRHMGLDNSGRVGRIVIDPRDSDVVFVAALGHLYGPQEERGVFKTTDGGETWSRVLFVDQNTGAVDLAMDPGNPRILYAATWQMRIWTWGRESGGTGSGIHRSRDSGETWERLEGGGLPRGPLGKIGLAISADDPSRVYALIETSSFTEFAPVEDLGVLWRSDDRGDSWELISRDHTLTQRPLYYTRAVAAPDDANEIHFMAVLHSRSLDGGRTTDRLRSGGDHHDMWIDPSIPDRMIVGHDQGVSISMNRGESWLRPTLPVAQMYHVWTDNRVPYFLYGNRQDGPSFRGPSNNLAGGNIPTTAWHSVGGCESGWAIPDPVDDNIVWSGCYDSILERYDLRTGHARNVSVWPDNPEGWAAGDVRYRFQWTFPVAISPHDNTVVYAGSQFVHRTADGGNSWRVISPDLTTNDPELQQKTGGLTPDDSSPTYAAVLFALAESPLEQGVIWAGSNDGLLHVSRDGGGSWTNVSDNMEGLPPLGTMSSIEPSRHAPGKAYVAVDMHQVNSTEPELYRTDNYGATWQRITDGIPAGPLSYTHVLREDPVRPGLLYAGTGNALYVSFDDGASWQSLQNNLPHAPVHWITVQEHFNDLVVSTYGRGFWILDDITPLRQHHAGGPGAGLLPPRAAYRFVRKEARVAPANDSGAGDNPSYGASIHYRIDAGGAPVRLEILDATGETIRTLGRLPSHPGLHRAYWNLRMESSPAPQLRTQPRDHPHAEFNEAGWRPLVEGGRVAPLAPPGTYTLRLHVGDQTFEQALEVRKDPSSTSTAQDIARQTQFLLAIRDDVRRVVELIDEIELAREQLIALEGRLADDAELADLKDSADSIEGDLAALEMNLHDLRMTGGTAFQDTLRWPRQLYAKLTSLAGYASSADFPPTTQQVEVHAAYQEQLASHLAAMAPLRERIAALNGALAARGFGVITVEG